MVCLSKYQEVFHLHTQHNPCQDNLLNMVRPAAVSCVSGCDMQHDQMQEQCSLISVTLAICHQICQQCRDRPIPQEWLGRVLQSNQRAASLQRWTELPGHTHQPAPAAAPAILVVCQIHVNRHSAQACVATTTDPNPQLSQQSCSAV